jgi:hypothetical protein
VNYAGLTQPTTKTVGTVDIADCGVGGLDVGLETELASFATLTQATAQPVAAGQEVIPGQLDILQLLDPTASNDPRSTREP